LLGIELEGAQEMWFRSVVTVQSAEDGAEIDLDPGLGRQEGEARSK